MSARRRLHAYFSLASHLIMPRTDVTGCVSLIIRLVSTLGCCMWSFASTYSLDVTVLFFFFLRIRPPPSSTLFPYPTLFRSWVVRRRAGTSVRSPPRPGVPGGGLADGARLGGDLHRSVDVALGKGGQRQHGAGNHRHHVHLVDRKSTRLNSSHLVISYAVFCL